MSKEDLLKTLHTQLPLLKSKYGIDRLGVFGSYARNEQSEESDLDLFYEMQEGTLLGLFQVMDLEEYLKGILKIKRIDLVNARWINPLIAYEMRKDLIYVQ
ncbi:nucleotidyltransferase family protein [Nibrella saemangeumensis]|uniref:Nucleotidyltransferase family protein n=1 Tax=Nibrella saemangeumensis TaxID=1084526 RepID=A0ABP8MH64_9BACT